MYVIDEAFDMWLIKKNPYDYAGEKFSKWWKDDIAAMISKDYNHPSVVMYSIGNEITELGLATGQEQARIMTEFCHTQDHTRPVTAGINLMLATMAKSKKSIYGTDEDGNVNIFNIMLYILLIFVLRQNKKSPIKPQGQQVRLTLG